MSAQSIKARIKTHRFFSGEKADSEPITLNHRRIFILPTQRGFNFVLLMILLLLIAFVYNNNLAYLLTFLLASIFFVTILHTFRSLSGLTLQKGQPNAVFLGEAAEFLLHVNNPTDLERYNVQVRLEKSKSVSIKMNSHSKTNVTLYSATVKRGWHEAGKVTVFSTFPLGLFRAWSPIRFDLKVLVYPKPTHFSSAFPETASEQSQQGTGKKGTDDFYGLQEYQSGDSIKHIHWKAFAKGLGLFSKQYGSQNAAEIWLDYEHTPGNNIEERLSYLCRWVIEAEQAGILYGFCLPGLRLAPDHGLLHSRKCLEALALF
ncbi:MAG: DUF58 domain-containing protein [Methylococcaceae bacterium]